MSKLKSDVCVCIVLYFNLIIHFKTKIYFCKYYKPH